MRKKEQIKQLQQNLDVLMNKIAVLQSQYDRQDFQINNMLTIFDSELANLRKRCDVIQEFLHAQSTVSEALNQYVRQIGDAVGNLLKSVATLYKIVNAPKKNLEEQYVPPKPVPPKKHDISEVG